MNVLIKNGIVVNHDQQFEADVWIKNGKIEQVGRDLPDQGYDEILDAGGKFVIPGGIDPHVHMQLPTPAGPSSDDFLSGSKAAIFGGTTMIMDFVTPHRGQSMVKAVKERFHEASASLINVELHVSPVEWRSTTQSEILTCINGYGIKSFKCYMAYKNTIGLDDDALFEVMKVVGKAGGIVMLHCEDGDKIEILRDEYAGIGLPGPMAHWKSRPPELEAVAVSRAIAIAEKAACPLYIVHVSTGKSLQIIRSARERGQDVYAETCPQYLLLDQSLYRSNSDDALKYVISPPLRSRSDNQALWAGLAEGTVSTIGTDHCPFTLRQKLKGEDDFRVIPNGAGGVEHRLSLIYTFGVLKNRFGMQRFVELTSTSASKIFGLYPKKGIIAEGSDADLVIWNPSVKNTISVKSHHQQCDLNIYEGIETTGAPEVVFLGGNIVLKDGNLV